MHLRQRVGMLTVLPTDTRTGHGVSRDVEKGEPPSVSVRGSDYPVLDIAHRDRLARHRGL